MALVLGRPVQRVSVLPDRVRLGHCEFKKGKTRPIHDPLETEILVLLGGLAAEARYTGRYCLSGAAQDLRSVRSLAQMRAAGQKQVERLERRLLNKAENILDQPGIWSATERIAGELLRLTTISGRAVRHLFEQAAAS